MKWPDVLQRRMCCWLLQVSALCLLCLPAWALSPLAATFKPPSDAMPPFYAIAQGENQHIYVGASNALLAFDGIRWQQLPIAGPVRGLKPTSVAGRKQLWIAGFGTFGFVEHDPTGQMHYTDLMGSFGKVLDGRAIAEIWKVHPRPEGVYFTALRDLFLVSYDGKPLHHWHHDGRFGDMTSWRGKLLLQWRGEGLKTLEPDGFALVPGTEIFAGSLVKDMLPLGGDEILLSGPMFPLQIWNGLNSVPLGDWVAPDEHRTLQGVERLPDGSVAYGALDGILRIFDLPNHSIRRLKLGASFLPKPLSDRSGALWVLNGDQLSYMPWPSGWGRIADLSKASADAYRFKQVGDSDYLATIHGLMVAPHGQLDATFVKVPWLRDTGAWDVLPMGADLLVAGHQSLHVKTGDQVRVMPAADLYPRALFTSTQSPDMVLVATEEGLAVLRRSKGQWELAAHHKTLALETRDVIQEPSSSGEPMVLWLGSEKLGVLRVQLSADGTQVQRREVMGAAQGLPGGNGGGGSIALVNGRILASTNAGLFLWAGERFAQTDLDGLGKQLLKGEIVSFRFGSDGSRWAFSERRIYRQASGQNWRVEPVSDYRIGIFQNLDLDEQGEAMVAGSSGLYRSTLQEQSSRIERARLLASQAGHAVVADDGSPALVSVQAFLGEGGIRRFALAAPAALPPGPVMLQFDLGYSNYARTQAPQFRARLVGYDNAWSGWSESASFTFARLPHGVYRFEAQARDGQGRESAIEPFRLNVGARWYETPLALMAAVCGAVLALAFTVISLTRWRTRRLNALVKLRTSELQDAVDRLDALASIDGLTGVANRRRFDAALESALVMSWRDESTVALLLIDVDHFKDYNDAHGHLGGDQVLRDIAQSLLRGSRLAGALVCRYGGEEFALLVPTMNEAASLSMADQLRQQVAGLSASVTVSIGVAVSRGNQQETAAELIARADAALYQAKRAGRNRCEMAAPAATL